MPTRNDRGKVASIKSFKGTITRNGRRAEWISMKSTQLKSQLNLEEFNSTKIDDIQLSCHGHQDPLGGFV
jgi:hypothetical protein